MDAKFASRIMVIGGFIENWSLVTQFFAFLNILDHILIFFTPAAGKNIKFLLNKKKVSAEYKFKLVY